MFSKRSFIDFILLLTIASFLFLTYLNQDTVGLWEPWETSSLLSAQQIAKSNVLESTFWVPQLNDEFIAQPLLQQWCLALMLKLSPELDSFMLRLPSCFLAIILVLLTFRAVSRAASRRSAWIASIVLLTIPMFVLSGKLLHGGIWIIFAVSLPNLLYLMSLYADTRRMQRTMLSGTSLSLVISFLCGGLFALAILLTEFVIFILLSVKHPQREKIFAPLKTRYFLCPLYVSFVINTAFFGMFVSMSRYALEERTPMTLAQINNALDEDRIVAIERRRTQIIGTIRQPDGSGEVEEHPFVLVESAENLSTDATSIIEQNDSEKRTFSNYMMWRFQKQTPSLAAESVPPMHGAIQAAVRFFWFHSANGWSNTDMPLAIASAKAIADNPDLSTIHSTDAVTASDSEVLALEGVSFETQMKLTPGSLVRIISSDAASDWAEIEDGSGQTGFVKKDVLEVSKVRSPFNFTSWLDILLNGLFIWSAFFPLAIIGGLLSVQRINIAKSPFTSEFDFTAHEDASAWRSPAQSFLLSWILAGILALIIGINSHNYQIYTAVIPFAALLGIVLSSSRLWRQIIEIIEARFLLLIGSWLCLGLIIYHLHGQHFRLIRYLLVDPVMNWGNANTIEIGNIVFFCTLFALLTLISFSGTVETIQQKVSEWRENRKPQNDTGGDAGPSHSSLVKISCETLDPMPYVPVILLSLLAILGSGYIYFSYLPSVSDQFTETALVQKYFELADSSEPLYLLSGENEQLCRDYRDCEPGYVCQDARCRISTFASYSLSIANPVTREDMVHNIAPEDDADPAFYIIPKDSLFGINQIYRAMWPSENRKNLAVVDAPSSRLYLVRSHDNDASVNPYNTVFINTLPEDATPLSIQLGSILIRGFKINSLDFENDNTLSMTLYYELTQPLSDKTEFHFFFELSGRRHEYTQKILSGDVDEFNLLVNDLIADTMTFDVHIMPNHGYLDIRIASNNDKSEEPKRLTTIGL